jgi:hypothetical protein
MTGAGLPSIVLLRDADAIPDLTVTIYLAVRGVEQSVTTTGAGKGQRL